MFFVIDDDRLMAECVKRVAKAVSKTEVRGFSNGIEAMQALNGDLPSLIFLDVLLDGPDGFSFLNELSSYEDTAKIPVVIITSLSLSSQQLENYGVVAVLKKDEMTPADLQRYIIRYEGKTHAK